ENGYDRRRHQDGHHSKDARSKLAPRTAVKLRSLLGHLISRDQSGAAGTDAAPPSAEVTGLPILLMSLLEPRGSAAQFSGGGLSKRARNLLHRRRAERLPVAQRYIG